MSQASGKSLQDITEGALLGSRRWRMRMHFIRINGPPKCGDYDNLPYPDSSPLP